jgi:hypothetical protein
MRSLALLLAALLCLACYRQVPVAQPGTARTIGTVTLRDGTVVRSSSRQKLTWDSAGVTVSNRQTGTVTRHIDSGDVSRVTRSQLSPLTFLVLPLIGLALVEIWTGLTWDGL